MLKPIRIGTLVGAAILLSIIGSALTAEAYQTGFGTPQVVSMLDASTPACASSEANAAIAQPYAPRYPEIAFEQGVEGDSLVTFNMALNGSVSQVKLAGTSGNRWLDLAAVNAVKRTQFAPAVHNCSKVAGEYGVRVIFSMAPSSDLAGSIPLSTLGGRATIK